MVQITDHLTLTNPGNLHRIRIKFMLPYILVQNAESSPPPSRPNLHKNITGFLTGLFNKSDLAENIFA